MDVWHGLKGLKVITYFHKKVHVKDTVMQIEKELTNDQLRVSEVSWRYYIPTSYNFALVYP